MLVIGRNMRDVLVLTQRLGGSNNISTRCQQVTRKTALPMSLKAIGEALSTLLD